VDQIIERDDEAEPEDQQVPADDARDDHQRQGGQKDQVILPSD
jgi:hypothetical protein